ncbi:MAG: hypothetical protein CL521_04250 [Actinobacteria bacterium]|nr:hypothetical protein [Actinomycetota bacterium]
MFRVVGISPGVQAVASIWPKGSVFTRLFSASSISRRRTNTRHQRVEPRVHQVPDKPSRLSEEEQQIRKQEIADKLASLRETWGTVGQHHGSWH